MFSFPDLDDNVANYYEIDITNHFTIIKSMSEGTNIFQYKKIRDKLENINYFLPDDITQLYTYARDYFSCYYKYLYFFTNHYTQQEHKYIEKLNLSILRLFDILEYLMVQNYEIREFIFFHSHKQHNDYSSPIFINYAFFGENFH